MDLDQASVGSWGVGELTCVYADIWWQEKASSPLFSCPSDAIDLYYLCQEIINEIGRYSACITKPVSPFPWHFFWVNSRVLWRFVPFLCVFEKVYVYTQKEIMGVFVQVFPRYKIPTLVSASSRRRNASPTNPCISCHASKFRVLKFTSLFKWHAWLYHPGHENAQELHISIAVKHFLRSFLNFQMFFHAFIILELFSYYSVYSIRHRFIFFFLLPWSVLLLAELQSRERTCCVSEVREM